ncbi:EAL domain-containing protein [Deinococcus sp. UYEF24]
MNVSGLGFLRPDFNDHLRRVIEASGTEPGQFWLELTESSLLEPRVVSVLQELKTRGVKTALDDFGNGYSSLMAL